MSDEDTVEKLRVDLRGGLAADDALRRAELLLHDYPDRPELWCLTGDLIQLSQSGEYDLQRAEQSYQRALQIDPDCGEAHEGLGYLYDKVYDDPQKARPYFEKAISLGRQASREGLRDVLHQLRLKNER